MEFWQIIILYTISHIIIQIGIIVRKKIIEKNKLNRIEKLKTLDNSKIEAIGNYEKKSSFWSWIKTPKN